MSVKSTTVSKKTNAFDKSGHNLTRKQKAFCDTLLSDEKLSPTMAAMKVYGKPDKPTNTTKR